jgi:hypothetical protein
MEMIIIFVIIIVCCCCSISLSGGGYYYYSIQPTQKSATSTPKPVIADKSGSTNSTPSNTSGSSSSNTPAPTLSKEPEKDPKDTQEKDKYKIKDPEGIKTGKYNNISNTTFGLSGDLTRWSLTIILNSDMYSGSSQSLVGNMYNKEVATGWGLWINPEGLLHFRINDKSWNIKDLGKFINKNPYKIGLSYSHRTGYTFNSTNLKFFSEDGKKKEVELNAADDAIAAVAANNPFALFNAIADAKVNDGNKGITSSFIDNTTKLISDKGFITVGGWWENNNNEKFKGDINYLEFYKIM